MTAIVVLPQLSIFPIYIIVKETNRYHHIIESKASKRGEYEAKWENLNEDDIYWLLKSIMLLS